jgi:hypothetical protein
VLLEAARTFNTYTAPRLVSGGGPARPQVRRGDRPGDQFNARTTWAQLLEPYGWRRLFAKGEVTVWKRPGKDRPGGSATTNFGGSDLFYPFSSNAAPFEPETAYPKFAANALLQHGGEFGAAARELRRELALTPSYRVTANDPFVKDSPYYPAWLQQATHPLPGHARINEVNTVLGNLVAQVCQGKIGARDAVTQGEREGTALLQQK